MNARETVARLLPLEETTWVDGAGLNGAFAPVGGGYWDDIRRACEEEPAGCRSLAASTGMKLALLDTR